MLGRCTGAASMGPSEKELSCDPGCLVLQGSDTEICWNWLGEWEAAFYVPPVLGGAALFGTSAPAVYRIQYKLGHRIFVQRWRWIKKRAAPPRTGGIQESVSRRGCTRCFDQLERSPESLLHQRNPVLHQCNTLLHQCHPVFSPHAPKHLLHPLLTTLGTFEVPDPCSRHSTHPAECKESYKLWDHAELAWHGKRPKAGNREKTGKPNGKRPPAGQGAKLGKNGPKMGKKNWKTP